MNNILRFFSSDNEFTTLAKTANTLYVLDANVVLTLLQNHKDTRTLSLSYQNFLKVTRREVGKQFWENKAKKRTARVPVYAVQAALELSQINQVPNNLRFKNYYCDFLEKIYGIPRPPDSWLDTVFEGQVRLLNSGLRSLELFFQKVLTEMPAENAISSAVIEQASEKIFEWIYDHKHQLSIIGGAALRTAIFAIAGNSQARALLKVKEVAKKELEIVARNVSWDFYNYYVMTVLRNKTNFNCKIFCTADKHLADMFKAQKEISGSVAGLVPIAIGSADAPVLYRLKCFNATKLSTKINERYIRLVDDLLASEIELSAYPP